MEYRVEIKIKEEGVSGSNQPQITVLNDIFLEEKARKATIKNILAFLEAEKKRWIKENCSFNIEMLRGKSFREKVLFLISIPLDWYVINRYFNLLKNFSKMVIELCNLDLTQEKFNTLLNKLKEETKELKFLDKAFSDYCNFDSFYYQKIKEIFDKRIFYCIDSPEANEIVKKIKEII